MAGTAPAPSLGDLRMASMRAAILSLASAAVVVASLGYAVVELRNDERVIADLRAQLNAAPGVPPSADATGDKGLETRLISTQAQLIDAQKRAGELGDWNAKAQNQINELKQDNDKLLGDLNNANGQIVVLNGQIADLKTRTNSPEGTSDKFNDLQGKYSELQGRLIELQRALRECQAHPARPYKPAPARPPG